MKKLLIMTMLIMTAMVSRVDGASDDAAIEKAFRSAAESIPLDRRKSVVDAKASDLIKRYGEQITSNLEANILSHDPRDRYLALAAIIKLDNKQSVADALTNAVLLSDSLTRMDIVSTIAEMPETNVIDIAKKIIEKATTEEVTTAVLPLFGLTGDENTITYLMKYKNAGASDYFKNAFRDAEKKLRYRMSLNSVDRKEWDKQALPFWQISFYYIMAITEEIEYFKEARILKAEGHKFSLAFLRYQLEEGHPLAAAIMGVQREQSAQDLLSSHLNDQGAMQEVCRTALGLINESDKP
jgi:hypothetical protein